LLLTLKIMISSQTLCSTGRASSLLTALLFFFFALEAHAQIVPSDNDQVVVIGSRFPIASDLAPPGASVITAEQIRNAGIGNANEAIRKLGGVYGRQNFYGTADYDLDLNGFGSDSANNLVILVDGVRLSENEQSVAVLSSIPVDSIARIEIMHSGSSVLYGDGATGGVIQVITKQLGPAPLTGSLVADLGQFNDHAGRAFLSRGWDDVNVSLNLSDEKSDSYRVNNAITQKNASGALTWYGADSRVGVRFDIAHQEGGLPGALATLAQFETDPRQSLNPHDNGSTDINRYSGFAEKTLGDWQLIAELMTRERTVQSDYVSEQLTSTYSGRQTEFTPRVRQVSVIDGFHNELVMGLDLMNWNRQTDSSYSMAYATQKSHALYFRDEVGAGNARVAFGARRELFEKSSIDPIPYAVDNYQVNQAVNAWEIEGSYHFAPEALGFAKTGQSYRVANVDDNAYTAVPNVALLPQLSHDLEIGATLGDKAQQLTVRIFRHELTGEIYFNPLLNGGYGANSNLDPTRRQGVAVESKLQLSHQFTLAAQAQHVDASFTGGSNDGKELVLVPKNVITAHLNWLPGDGQNAWVGTQWVDAQRYGGDFSNTCAALIPSHATLDARYARTLGSWEWSVAGSNLTDRHYFTNAYGCMTGIYPDDGRQMKVSLRYSF